MKPQKKKGHTPMTTATVAQAPKVEKVEQVHLVKLTDIAVPANWNTRSGAWRDEKLEELDAQENPSGGIEALAADIAKNGQDTPILLRPNPRTGAKAYMLVAGFRRFEAICRNAEKNGVKATATIKAFVREMSDLDARKANLRENTDRENLSAPDLAWGLWELIRSGGPNATQPTDVQLAEDLGLTQSYVSKLHRIMRKVEPAITSDWRGAMRQLSVNDMIKLSELPTGEQRQAYNLMTQAKEVSGSKGEGEGKGSAAYIDGKKKQAAELGQLLAKLAQVEVIAVPTDVDWAVLVKTALTIKEKHKDGTKISLGPIGTACRKGFEAGLIAAHEEEEKAAAAEKARLAGNAASSKAAKEAQEVSTN